MTSVDYETAIGIRGVGFSFEIPVPLPDLGHQFALGFNVGGHDALLLVVQVPTDHPVGGVRMEGPGLRDHERDRFGVFSRSRVEIRMLGGPQVIQGLGFIDVMARVPMPNGQLGVLLGPSVVGREFCVGVVNDLIDAYTRVHETYWLATVTPDDIVSLRVVDWDDPAHPAVVSMMFGTGAAYEIRFGRREGYAATAPEQVRAELSRPPSLAEDLLLSARRDLATRRARSAVAHACLAFEVFVRGLLEANATRVPDPHFRTRTMKELCQRKGCLPALIGDPLNNEVHGAHRHDYEVIVRLRDHLLHQGRAAYEKDGMLIEVVGDHEISDLIETVTRLAMYLNARVEATGGLPVRLE